MMHSVRFGLAYFFFFALLGVWVPYLAVHLDILGFDAKIIGAVFSIFLGTRVIAPYLLQPALKRGTDVYYLLCLCLLVALSSSLFLYISVDLWAIISATLLFSLCWNAALPLLETYCLSSVGADPGLYGRIRIGGSVGFVVASMLGGIVLAPFDATSFPLGATVVLALCVLSVWWLPRVKAAGEAKTMFMTRRQWRATAVFFVSCFMLQVSHGVYYAFFTPLLALNDYGELAISSLWSIAVVSEVFVFMMASVLFKRFSVEWVLAAGLLVSALRWWLTPLIAEEISYLYLAQLLHGISFGASHAAAMIWLSKNLQSSATIAAQALYSALCFGLGGALGSSFGGFLWDIEPIYSYYFAAFVSLFGFFIWQLRAHYGSKY